MEDRNAILPHESYGKFQYSEQLRQPEMDWEASCPQFIAECLHKQEHPLFAIKWMKDGKRLITGTSKGEILTWNPQRY